MSWAGRRRTMYIGGIVATLLIVVGIPLIFILHEPPTCFDGSKNGAERGVDCGGSCALLCPFEITKPTILWSRVFKITEGVYNAVAYIEHPNSNSGVIEAPYTFKLFDSFNILITERTGITFLLPNTLTPIFEGGITTGERIPARTFFEFNTDLRWIRTPEKEHSLFVKNQRLSNIEKTPRIDAVVENVSVDDLFDLEVVGVVFDVDDNAIAASRTIIPLLERQSSEEIVFTWPEPFLKKVERCAAPIDVLLLIDTSGSMNDDSTDPPQPLTDAKAAASDFVGRLSKNDRIGIVSFATEAKVEQPLLSTFDVARGVVSSIFIKPEEEVGSTNTGDAIKKAIEVFTVAPPKSKGSNTGEEDRKIIVLLTDGLANEPEDPGGEPYATEHSNKAKAQGVQIYTIGLGDKVNAGFLRGLASEPQKYYQAAESRDLDRIYREISDDLCESGPAVIDVIPKPKNVFFE